MSDNPRIQKQKLPSAELNDLLVWVIKPVKELEQKLEEKVNELNEVVKNCQSEVAGIKDQIPDLRKEFEKLAAIPAKQELRISAIESRLKHYEDIVNGVQNNKFALEKVKQDVSVNSEDLDRTQSEIKSISDRMVNLRNEIIELHNARREHVENHEVLKAQVKEAAADHKKLSRQYAESNNSYVFEKDKIRSEVKEQFEKLNNKIQNINDHVELYRNQLVKVDQDNALSAMNAVESLKKNLVEDFASRIKHLEDSFNSEDDRFKDVKYEIELIDKRCDKLGTLLKEVKAELGV